MVRGRAGSRAQMSRAVLSPPHLLLLVIALGAAPATNPANTREIPGKFDNVALRATPLTSGAIKNAPSTPLTPEGLDIRRILLALAAVISLIFLLRLAARRFFPQVGA